MKRIILLFTIIFLFLIFCSEKKEPTQVTTHPSNWLQVHGTAVLDSSLSKESCQVCHGTDFSGGSSGVSCLNCHFYPHLPQWSDSTSPGFHGVTAKAAGNDTCQVCHGADYQGGNTGVSCYNCHNYPHLSAWHDSTSAGFHGKAVLQTGKQECQPCHGTDFSGGSSQVSCFQCHTYPHKDGFGTVSSPNFHRGFVKSEIYWHIGKCQPCHGSNYAGGRVNVSCTNCHIYTAGPEACNTCHGDFNDPGNIAPPQDLQDNLDHTAVGVGAHQKHVRDTRITNTYDCNVCHPAVPDFNTPTHIDDIPLAEIQFNPFARDSGRLNPQWDHAVATCSDAYCHGNFIFYKDSSANQWAYADSVIRGNQLPAVWTQINAAPDTCTFCHDLPPTGHIPATITTCSLCHSAVIDANGKIIAPDKHINGKANLSN